MLLCSLLNVLFNTQISELHIEHYGVLCRYTPTSDNLQYVRYLIHEKRKLLWCFKYAEQIIAELNFFLIYYTVKLCPLHPQKAAIQATEQNSFQIKVCK